MVQKIRQRHGALFDDTPRGILEALLIAGGITVALSASPLFLVALGSVGYALKAEDKARQRKLGQYFSHLQRRKYISVGHGAKNRVTISLTSIGKRRALSARAHRLVSTPIARPRAWDGKWRLILFDIAAEERRKRNAFRSFIRRIGAVMLQKSVWLHPFDCTEQIDLLRDFFNLSTDELRIIVTDKLEHDRSLRQHFKL